MAEPSFCVEALHLKSRIGYGYGSPALPGSTVPVPGGGRPAAASSITNTQSSLVGGVKFRLPVEASSVPASAEPLRGLNHHAVTFVPASASRLTVSVRREGA